jgi:protocatechuate 3,4-dioxygenase beta subunit
MINTQYSQTLNRRRFLKLFFAVFAAVTWALILFNGRSYSQSRSTIDSTSTASWKIVIPSKDEPGEPLVVSGTVYKPDGKTPAEDITVYVYHTDAEGYYRKGTTSSSNPRLKGTMITNAEGKYEFRTIKPGSYPQGRAAAHIHYVISGKGHEKQYGELMFEGDPDLSDRARANAAKDGTFATVRPLTRGNDGVWRCVRDLKLERK